MYLVHLRIMCFVLVVVFIFCFLKFASVYTGFIFKLCWNFCTGLLKTNKQHRKWRYNEQNATSAGVYALKRHFYRRFKIFLNLCYMETLDAMAFHSFLFLIFIWKRHPNWRFTALKFNLYMETLDELAF